MKNRLIELPGGALSVSVDQSDMPLDCLCGFAGRRNPKRPFLFVSRILGRHLPVAPRIMRESWRRLAAKLPEDLPGPILAVGFAETAIALGQGIFESVLERWPRKEGLYLHSTRYRLNHPLLASFDESHSHATAHLLYRPLGPEENRVLESAETLLLIDDEASTGSTFAKLATLLCARLPRLNAIICITLTDWMGEERRAEIANAAPKEMRFVSLLTGKYDFAPSGAPAPKLPDVVGNGALKDALLPTNRGRLGVSAPLALPRAALDIAAEKGQKILVLGSGEFVYPPFLLAERLERMGATVRVQATTRSPILKGADIRSVLTFRDCYDDDIPNFLYSATPDQYDRIYVCYETPPAQRQRDLIDALRAEPVFFE